MTNGSKSVDCAEAANPISKKDARSIFFMVRLFFAKYSRINPMIYCLFNGFYKVFLVVKKKYLRMVSYSNNPYF